MPRKYTMRSKEEKLSSVKAVLSVRRTGICQSPIISLILFA